MITYKLAQQIVSQTMLRLHHNINVISLDGTIIASGDSTRIEKTHSAAKEVLETKKPVIIFEEDIVRYPTAKPGINLPIFFQDEIVCIIGITGNPQEVSEISTLVQLTTEIIVNQALLESKSEWQRKMSDHIFNELSEGAEIKGVLKERINKLPFELRGPFAVSIIQAKHKTSSHRTLIQYLEDYFYEQPILYGHHHLNEYFILTTNINDMALNKMMTSLYSFLNKQFDIKIGVGKIVDSLSQIPKSYKGARLALDDQDSTGDLTFFETIEVKSLFKEDEVLEYSKKVLAGLDEKLLQTLTELFQSNFHLNDTAEGLQIHRHTLTYRIEKIREKTQLDPLHFEDAMKLQIALWFYKKKRVH